MCLPHRWPGVGRPYRTAVVDSRRTLLPVHGSTSIGFRYSCVLLLPVQMYLYIDLDLYSTVQR